MRGIVANEWAGYLERAMPGNASPVQVQECKRAFYAGVRTINTIIAKLSEGDGVSDDDISVVAGVEAELAAFLAEVVGGRA